MQAMNEVLTERQQLCRSSAIDLLCNTLEQIGAGNPPGPEDLRDRSQTIVDFIIQSTWAEDRRTPHSLAVHRLINQGELRLKDGDT